MKARIPAFVELGGLLAVVLLALACSLNQEDVRVPYAAGSSGLVETGGGVKVRVTIDAISGPVTSSFANPEVGFHFMVIDLTVENAGEKETTGGSFILRMEDGFEYRDRFIPGLETDVNYRQRLTSGGKTALRLGFEVRDGSVVEWLKFDPQVLAKGDLYFDGPGYQTQTPE